MPPLPPFPMLDLSDQQAWPPHFQWPHRTTNRGQGIDADFQQAVGCAGPGTVGSGLGLGGGPPFPGPAAGFGSAVGEKPGKWEHPWLRLVRLIADPGSHRGQILESGCRPVPVPCFVCTPGRYGTRGSDSRSPPAPLHESGGRVDTPGRPSSENAWTVRHQTMARSHQTCV